MFSALNRGFITKSKTIIKKVRREKLFKENNNNNFKKHFFREKNEWNNRH